MGQTGLETIDRQQEVKQPLVTTNTCRRQSEYIQIPLFSLYLGMCVTKSPTVGNNCHHKARRALHNSPFSLR